ncbi:hypothetical protein TL16_g02536 [Triparma laevis f. inornata]|uniref:Uncharacterized protein n=1 Tax=Triparma laevis f. inornata TaxID=1714386 RepID=A0A9W6ZRN2_9STRA|nr:hypothetical protein TL16_g02536 [Triparma laevis f. inornata]
MAKAKLALETGDEALAKEVLALRETQLQASEDVLLHVDHEKTKLLNLNKSLQDYNEAHCSPSYVHDTFPELSPLPARAFPKTPQLKFDAPTSSNVIDGWITAFDCEKKNYDSFALYAESKLQEAITASNINSSNNSMDSGLPAVCCNLLFKMSDSATGFRFAPLLRLLSEQIVKISYDTKQKPFSAEDCSIRWLSSQTPWFQQCKELLEERDRLKEIVSFENQSKDIQKVLDGRNSGIKMMFNREQAMLRQFVFRSWRNWHLSEMARRNKFLRYQKNKWMRRWKNLIFGDLGDTSTTGSGTNSQGSGGGGGMWQKRFRQAQEEKQLLHDQIAHLHHELEETRLELGVTYEIIHELQPGLDHSQAGAQSAATQRHGRMRRMSDVHGLKTHSPINFQAKASAAEPKKKMMRHATAGKLMAGIGGWKKKVGERMDKHKKGAGLASFAKENVVMKSSASQTTHTGELRATRTQSKTILSSKSRRKEPLSIDEILQFSHVEKAPKTTFRQAIMSVSELMGYACFMKHHSLNFGEFMRDCMIKRHGVKSLAVKHMKGLVSFAKKNEKEDILLEIFNELSGAPTIGPRLLKANCEQDVNMFVRFLKGCVEPPQDYMTITACLGSPLGGEERGRNWERSTILNSAYTNFPFLRIKKKEEYKKMVEEILALPVNTAKGAAKEPRIRLDSALLIIMKFIDVERKCSKDKPAAIDVTNAMLKMKVAVKNFAFKTCDERRKEMTRARKFFHDWDEKMHGEFDVDGELDEDKSFLLGSFSFDEFSEMLRGAAGNREVTDDDTMTLFNEWHELIDKEKMSLGYLEERAGDEVGMLTLEKHKDALDEVLHACEKEIVAAEEILERKKTLGRADRRRKSSLIAMQGGEVEKQRPPPPLPRRAKANDKWRLAYRKLCSNFFTSGFDGRTDEQRARGVESAVGGNKFGEAAFAKLLWKHRIFIQLRAF